jgi:glycerophosphoryl diester phosphodiesterase
MAWTVDGPGDVRAQAEMGVDMIASNRLDMLIETLSEMGLR